MEFLKEAAIMHTIDHEHIVRLYGVVLDTNSLMLVRTRSYQMEVYGSNKLSLSTLLKW